MRVYEKRTESPAKGLVLFGRYGLIAEENYLMVKQSLANRTDDGIAKFGRQVNPTDDRTACGAEAGRPNPSHWLLPMKFLPPKLACATLAKPTSAI